MYDRSYSTYMIIVITDYYYNKIIDLLSENKDKEMINFWKE